MNENSWALSEKAIPWSPALQVQINFFICALQYPADRGLPNQYVSITQLCTILCQPHPLTPSSAKESDHPEVLKLTRSLGFYFTHLYGQYKGVQVDSQDLRDNDGNIGNRRHSRCSTCHSEAQPVHVAASTSSPAQARSDCRRGEPRCRWVAWTWKSQLCCPLLFHASQSRIQRLSASSQFPQSRSSLTQQIRERKHPS